MSEQLQFVKEIALRLVSAAIEYMFTGSIAMVFYATPSMTGDIDLVVQLQPTDAQKIFLVAPEDRILSDQA
ncbi:MAG TPA: hypothetical protein PLM07_16835 [Candidatus Rifleibacterium sp.]|nr:hypothetical protein [Candidatus Rifleibacterium sp.]HPT47551.1 hypothetical protein [Candidatus Rifleibacterium sp.]